MQYQINPQYMGDFAEACAGYGLDDVADQMSYYKDFAERSDQRTTLTSPQDLARMYAKEKHVDVKRDFNDEYFDEFIDVAKKRYGLDNDDYLLDFWEINTKFSKKTELTPQELAFNAKKDYVKSPFYRDKKLNVDDLEKIKNTAIPVDFKPEIVRINTFKMMHDAKYREEQRERFQNGFFYGTTYEKNPKFKVYWKYELNGNTDWDGERDRSGEDVRLYFTDKDGLDAFKIALWGGGSEVSHHIEMVTSRKKRKQ